VDGKKGKTGAYSLDQFGWCCGVEPLTPSPFFSEAVMFAFKTILHPTDFSASSEHAFQLAASLARDHGAHLIILHVDPPTRGVGPAMVVPPTPPGVYNDQLWEEFRRLTASDPRIREVHIKTELITGDPITEILEIARERDCDLIVMGTHGRTGLSRLLMGSVAEAVLRRASCPVLTVKGSVPVPSKSPVLEEAVPV